MVWVVVIDLLGLALSCKLGGQTGLKFLVTEGAARRALEPIDKFRAAAAKQNAAGGATAEGTEGGSEAEEDVALPEDAPDPEAEVPEVPAG